MTVGFTKSDAERISTAVKRVEHSAIGGKQYRRHRHNTGGGGDTYNGYFKLSQNGTDIQIHDAFADNDYADATNAGLAQINGSLFTIVKNAVTVTGDGFIYLHADITAGVINTPTLVFGTSFVYVADEFKGLIGRVKFTDGAITNISQEHNGLIYGWIYTENIT